MSHPGMCRGTGDARPQDPLVVVVTKAAGDEAELGGLDAGRRNVALFDVGRHVALSHDELRPAWSKPQIWDTI